MHLFLCSQAALLFLSLDGVLPTILCCCFTHNTLQHARCYIQGSVSLDSLLVSYDLFLNPPTPPSLQISLKLKERTYTPHRFILCVSSVTKFLRSGFTCFTFLCVSCRYCLLYLTREIDDIKFSLALKLSARSSAPYAWPPPSSSPTELLRGCLLVQVKRNGSSNGSEPSTTTMTTTRSITDTTCSFKALFLP